MFIEFNNASSDLQKVINLKDGRTKEIENQTNEVNLEFSKRRDRLQFHEKLVRGFHQALCQFKDTMDTVDEWCKKQKKEVGKVDLKDKKIAKTEIMKIDVSFTLSLCNVSSMGCVVGMTTSVESEYDLLLKVTVENRPLYNASTRVLIFEYFEAGTMKI